MVFNTDGDLHVLKSFDARLIVIYTAVVHKDVVLRVALAGDFSETTHANKLKAR